jgi:hypothetical protein
MTVSTAISASFYVKNGNSLSYIDRGDEEAVPNVREWQIRLYKRGAPTSGENHWGLITGKSAADVRAQLEKAQIFEKKWERWCGCGWGASTYYNPMGPIAVIETPQRSKLSQAVIDNANTIEDLHNYTWKLYERTNDLLYALGEADKNPFNHVGVTLHEYADNFQLVFKQMKTLHGVMDAVGRKGDNILRELDKVEKEIAKSNDAAKKFNAKITAAGQGQAGAVPKNVSVRDRSGKEIVQTMEVTPGRLIVRQRYAGGAETTFSVPVADVDRNALRMKEGPAPGLWLVTLSCDGNTIEKTSPWMNNKTTTDNVGAFEAIFSSRKEAEDFIAAAKSWKK